VNPGEPVYPSVRQSILDCAQGTLGEIAHARRRDATRIFAMPERPLVYLTDIVNSVFFPLSATGRSSPKSNLGFTARSGTPAENQHCQFDVL